MNLKNKKWSLIALLWTGIQWVLSQLKLTDFMTTNEAPIRVARDAVWFSDRYLGTDRILVWVGHGFDPLDNKDDRVRETRDLMKRHYPHVPYGLSVGNYRGPTPITLDTPVSFEPIEVSDGYFRLDVSWWPAGVYRLNYHGLPGVQTTRGTTLNPNRDHEVSWPIFWEQWDEETRKMAEGYVHQELNGAGKCFRILIRPDRSVEAFGDPWVAR